MDLFGNSNDWSTKLEPILTNYKSRKHPLDYHNWYQLLVMVVLSAQDSDANINAIAPALFKAYPNMQSLAAADKQMFLTYVSKVKNFGSKTNWLMEIAQNIQKDENIPLNMNGLIALKGIGRKSANVILREAKIAAEGIIADLHVIRVAPRIGLTVATSDGNKVEKQLMQVFPKSVWNEIGMSISFLGREICRPKPKCDSCFLKNCCAYYGNLEP